MQIISLSRVSFILIVCQTLIIAGCTKPIVFDQTWKNYPVQEAPSGAIHVSEKKYNRTNVSKKFDHWLVWCQTATDKAGPADYKSGVAIFGLRIKKDGKTLMAWSDKESNSPFESGGLFNRRPSWFKSDDRSYLPMYRMSGLVPNREPIFIAAFEFPDYVKHWWSYRFRYDYNSQYLIEIDYSCLSASLQLGIDLWQGRSSPHNGWDPECTGTKNNCEMYVSPWVHPNGEPGKVETIRISWRAGNLSIDYPKYAALAPAKLLPSDDIPPNGELTLVSHEENIPLVGFEDDLRFQTKPNGDSFGINVPISRDQINKMGSAISAMKPYASYAVFENGRWTLRSSRTYTDKILKGGVSGTSMDVTVHVNDDMRKNGPWVWFRMWGDTSDAVKNGNAGRLLIPQTSKYYRLGNKTMSPAYEWLYNVTNGKVLVVPNSSEKRSQRLE